MHKTLPKPVITGFFFIGIISATLFRSLVIVNRYFPLLSRTVWYTAVFGYIFFFGYRFYIARRRRRAVLEHRLIEKVQSSALGDLEKEELSYILSSIIKSKEMYNYIFIFCMSIIAIAADIALDFLF